MMKNLYHRLFRYKPEQEISSSENFITESLVHLLDLSRKYKTGFLIKFFEKLEQKIIKEDYEKVLIDTQRRFQTTYDLYAIPDITIQFNNLIIFIEVKYDSGINEYDLKSNIKITNVSKSKIMELKKH